MQLFEKSKTGKYCFDFLEYMVKIAFNFIIELKSYLGKFVLLQYLSRDIGTRDAEVFPHCDLCDTIS